MSDGNPAGTRAATSSKTANTTAIDSRSVPETWWKNGSLVTGFAVKTFINQDGAGRLTSAVMALLRGFGGKLREDLFPCVGMNRFSW